MTNLLIKLRETQIRERHQRFDNMLAPIFDQMILIHVNYNKSFQEALSSLNAGNSIVETVNILARAREDFEEARWRLRESASSYIGEDYPQPEKRFIFLVLNYFIDPRYRFPGDSIDLAIRDFEGNGSSYYNTPSTAAIERIAGIEDCKDAYAQLLDIKDTQSNIWSSVCLRYNQLKSEVYGPDYFLLRSGSDKAT